MTIEEIKGCGKEFLLAQDIAGVLQCGPHAIRVAARKNPRDLGFPVCVIGNRVKIPREPFLRFLGEA